jgi:hypothetical protein
MLKTGAPRTDAINELTRADVKKSSRRAQATDRLSKS